MKEQPPLNDGESGKVKKLRKRSSIDPNEGKTFSDKAELKMEDFVETVTEENVAEKIKMLEEIINIYPELQYATKMKIEAAIKEINSKILISNKELENKTGVDTERLSAERHELYKKSRALLKIKEYFQERLWKDQ